MASEMDCPDCGKKFDPVDACVVDNKVICPDCYKKLQDKE